MATKLIFYIHAKTKQTAQSLFFFPQNAIIAQFDLV